ncbi:glycerol dehydratase reactivase beta/small subunit family protein [Thermoanaerobacterium thermosaccharolyticum]|uniref:glycerol dehydratase reactivase beta/small subunit family protein n=1 Tax=Thermoanaerobacterium thermosaccharolyticum TaxID=1517 RepID=UPI0004B6FDB8
MEFIKPQIVIFANTENKYIVNEIKAGIEEEGALYKLADNKCNDAVEMAYEAAKASVLGVGIGIAGDSICMHCKNLELDMPLFFTETDMYLNPRIIGCNAARYVKGLPLKYID